MTSENVVMLQFGTESEQAGSDFRNAESHGGVSLMHQFHRASQLADELFVAELKNSQLTPRQFVVLSAVDANVGASQTQVVKLTGIDRSTIADIIRRMVKLELLARQRTKEDARAYSLSVTDYGKETLKSAHEAVAKVDQALLGRLTPVGAEELQKALATFTSDDE